MSLFDSGSHSMDFMHTSLLLWSHSCEMDQIHYDSQMISSIVKDFIEIEILVLFSLVDVNTFCSADEFLILMKSKHCIHHCLYR